MLRSCHASWKRILVLPLLLVGTGTWAGPSAEEEASRSDASPAVAEGKGAEGKGAEGKGASGAHSAGDLAKQLANPIANLVSVPFQLNIDAGVGPRRENGALLNIQPVMPITLNERWRLITRFILPISNVPGAAPGTRIAGHGDLLMSLFASQISQGSVTFGLGPAVSLPLAYRPELGSGSIGLGPTAVVLRQQGPWTYGALANHVWSVSSPVGRAKVSSTFVQPFLAHSTTEGATLTLLSETTYNWEASEGQRWLVPVILMVSKTFKVGDRPMSLGLGGRWNVVHPDSAGSWGLRLIYTLLFPVGPPG